MTDIIEFENWMKTAQEHFEKIQHNASHLLPDSQELITELSINIEELHVAVEELHLQNEELLATRQQLEMERQRYVELFDFAPDGYFVTDGEAIIQEVNRAAAQLLNVPQKYLTGKPLDIFVAQADRETFNSQWLDITTGFAQACEIASQGSGEVGWSDYATGNLIQDWEVHFQPRRGEPIPVGLSLSATCDTEGHLKKLLWLIRDLRQSKQAAAKIRQQAVLLDVATDAIWVRDLQGKILYWNQAAEKIYGWTAVEALEQFCDQLLLSPGSPQYRIAYQTTVKTGQWQGELQNVTKSGEEILVESHWTLVLDQAGTPQSILTVDSDITQKKQLENQLFRAKRLESLGTLAGGIAHDLNNILTPIVAISPVLKMQFPDLNPRTRDMLDIVESSGKRGTALIQQILGFAQGMEGKRMTIQLTPVIREVTQIIVETFPKSIELRMNIPRDLWAICGNCTQLHQVILNLCINARDAMPNGGILEISAKNLLGDEKFAGMHLAEEVWPYVAIAVSDSGVGIPAENLDVIFDPFFTTKDVGQGTGLGLSTVAGIVKSHGGFVEVSSQVGQGTQFRVFLPAVDVAEAVVEENDQLPEGNGELIFVVDDEVAICQTNKTILESYGYRVLTAHNGLEAIKLYTKHHSEISLVLMDMMMPSMDGATTIYSLLQMNLQIKIVIVSGLANRNQVPKMIASHVKAFLPKPYTSEELLQTLHSVISS